jgi:hypothetical protein
MAMLELERAFEKLLFAKIQGACCRRRYEYGLAHA